MGNLTTLDLGNTDPGGSFPLDLLNCSNLMGWNLSYNYMEGPLATRISQSTKLHTRDLSYSSFFGPVPDAFGNSPPKHLNLKAANFTGVLPSSLGNLTNLTEIHLSLANFTPTAGPSGFANLKLSGEIPADIGNLRSLSQMDVSHNQGSGAIPQSRTHLTNLSILDLRQNSSSGVIPPSTANLQALTELVLFENHFTGIVPGNSGKDYNLTRFE
ncbi:unnamed protein product, partial [Sphagnum compactum]